MSARHASWGEGVKWPEHGLRLSQLWWAVWVGVWLCGLPIRMRVHSLPGLLQRLTPAPRRAPRQDPLNMEQAVRLVRRMCRLRCVRGPLFPQACLRQALTLYHLLSRLSYPVAIHFGVYKVGEALCGQSWVTVDGQPVAERLPPEMLQDIYACPAASSYASQERSRVGRWS
jgi:transglutaminase superfamily protein